jgi:putative ABC transport system ATP-binding protein
MTVATPAIELQDISRDFSDGRITRTVLKPLTLTIHTHEFSVIAGPSGSGKTTLLTIMGLILTPTTGRIRVRGEDVTGTSEGALASLRMRSFGFVFQHADLIEALSVLQNIVLPTAVQGGSAYRKARPRALKLLEGFGLSAYAGAMPKQLSTGQRQRVAIARALINDPVLLLCDEPTSALDVESSEIVLETLKQLSRSEDRGVVMVSHDPRVFPYADRMIKLEDGEVVYDSREDGGER